MRPHWKDLMIGLAILAVIAGIPLGIWAVHNRTFRVLEEFSALWQTHDLLRHHLQTRYCWPESWEDLADEKGQVNGDGYGNTDLQFLRDRIEINFASEATHESPPDWFIRVRSNQCPEEESNANRRLQEHWRPSCKP